MGTDADAPTRGPFRTPVLLTGMAAEARIARRAGLPVACCGGDPQATAEALLAAGATGIVSFGIAGGLMPGLRAGTLIVGTAVTGDGLAFLASPSWRRRLLLALPQARPGAVAWASGPVATVADKQALHARTGALAVDLESLAVARACRERGRPFAVLRAVADAAGRPLPPAALAGLDRGGRMAPGPVLAALRDDPRQFPKQIAGLWRLGWDLWRALSALGAAARAFPVGSLGLDPLERVGDVA